MLELQPMDEIQFQVFCDWITKYHSAQIEANYSVSAAEALAEAEREVAGMQARHGLAAEIHAYNVVLKGGGDSIGYLWLDVDEELRRCIVGLLYIDERYRRMGYGKKAMELVEARMRSKGIGRITLHVFADNQKAQELYRHLGFRPAGLLLHKVIAGE